MKRRHLVIAVCKRVERIDFLVMTGRMDRIDKRVIARDFNSLKFMYQRFRYAVLQIGLGPASVRDFQQRDPTEVALAPQFDVVQFVQWYYVFFEHFVEQRIDEELLFFIRELLAPVPDRPEDHRVCTILRREATVVFRIEQERIEDRNVRRIPNRSQVRFRKLKRVRVLLQKLPDAVEEQ